jgi:hypothetical protein
MIAILGLTAQAYAKAYPSFFRGVRPLGMGNAFTALADDDNAIYYNPAGLAEIDHLDMGILNPLVEISKDSMNVYNDIQDTDFDDMSQVAELLRNHLGENQHVRAAAAPYVGFRVGKVGLMIGALAQATLDAAVRNPAWPEAHLDYIQDTGVVGGVGFKLPLTGLRLGATIKFVQRTSLDNIYSAADIADDGFEDQVNDDMKTGNGFSLDLGAMYRLPWHKFFDTNIALVVQNLPDMDFGDAKDMKMQANFGLAVSKSLAKFKLVGTLDFDDLTMHLDEDSDLTKRLHLGLEFKTPFFVSIRTGFNQGYWTAGATLDFRVIRIDFASYAEEIGAYAGQNMDRRYVAQITIGW